MRKTLIFTAIVALSSLVASAQHETMAQRTARVAQEQRAQRQGNRTNQTNSNQTNSTPTKSSTNPGQDTPGEVNLPDAVDIQGTPAVNASANSATITWHTNNVAATDVWLEGGGIRGHRNQYQRGGSRDHSVTFNNLKPRTSYTFKIRSKNGQVRYSNSFTTQG